MRLTLAAYVYVEREEGRSVYVCQPLRGLQVTTRDPLLANALSKLGGKMRKSMAGWFKEGKANRVGPWLYDPQTESRIEKLTLVLRDRTLRWKLLLVAFPCFDRYVVFSPAVPDVVFEISSLNDMESRAVEVYTNWAQKRVTRGEESDVVIAEPGDMWVEPLEIDIESSVRSRKKPKNILAALFGSEKMSGAEELHKVGHCLDDFASDYEPVLGRAALVDEVDRMLSRDDRQGVMLVGPAAVGKTAIVRECARRRMERHRNQRGHKPQVWQLSPQRLISGMSYLGQWEQRWLAILREASKRDHVLYFDDLVGFFTAGRTRDSSLSAADVLRSYLSENRVRLVAEVTDEELAILRRRDRALADRFHLVHVPSQSADDALPIVLQSTHNVEVQAGSFFHPEVLPLVMRHQEIFSPDRAFPGKAIDMTKTLVKHGTESVHRGIFYRLAGTQVGANLSLLLGRMGDQKNIEESLSQSLIGQPDAVRALSRVVVRFAQQLQPPDRPLGVLLFLGPTGVGKTESAKALTRLLYNDDSHLVRLDMNEMTTPMAAEQLVGTFDQPEGRLTAAIRRQPNSVILMDEIEKAHPDVFDYLLQVIGEGRLTDARGRVADFRSSIVIMTSNLGASEQSSSVGFDTTAERRIQIYKKAAQSFFRPEFFNRIDEVVAFRSLNAEDMEEIVRLQLDDVLSRDGLRRRDVFVRITESAVRRVIKTGFDSELGARAVRRKLEREIMGPLGSCLSGLPIENPALLKIADSPELPRLSCQVTELQSVPLGERHRITDLQRLIDVGEPLYESLDARLAELHPQLREADEQLGNKTADVSYYALREQVYRCSELLKLAKVVLSRQSEPRMDVATGPIAKPKREVERTGSRRMMRDWLAQEDLRSAITDSGAQGTSVEEVAAQIVDSFAIASAMVDFALSPRTCLVGLQSLSGSGAKSPTFTAEELLLRSIVFDEQFFDSLGGARGFFSRLVTCLRNRWQYEVSSEEYLGSFRRVSGVSLLGILTPLLGTYRTQARGNPAHLSVLRAIPIDSTTEPEEIPDIIAANRLIDAEGQIATPPEQLHPVTTIRGLIAERTVDFVSGASMVHSEDWYRSDNIQDLHMQWWTSCLPVPPAMLQIPTNES